MPKVLNIQKYSIHDGPGIRTTVFFKGCPLKCIWCHNPESQSYAYQIMYNEDKCSKCGACVQKCNNKCISIDEDRLKNDFTKCEFCENCIDFCINNARELVGNEYTVDELMKEIEKDMMFYEESKGGVTLSGGEVMTQDVDYVEKIVKSCYKKGISVVIDTCGYAPFENFERIIPYVDTFLYDIKLINSQKHKLYTGKDSDLILDNLVKLSEKNVNLNIRIPLIDGINTDDESIDDMIKFLKKIKVYRVNLLAYHDIGKDKYKRLDMTYQDDKLNRPCDEKLKEIKSKFESNNFNVKIGG